MAPGAARRSCAGRGPACALALLCAACVTVPTGHAAVVTGLSGLEPPLGEGAHLVGPFASAELLDLRQQEHDETLQAITADGAAVEAGTSLVTWRVAPDELLALTREVGPDVYAVAIGPEVGSATRRVLGRLRLDQLDTPRLREAQAEITRIAAARLRPLHLILESVDLREVSPTSAVVRRGYEAAAAKEQEALAAPDRLRLAAERAAQLRERAAGIDAAHATLAPTLDEGALEEMRARAFRQLLESYNASAVTGGSPALEVSP